ncbi:MAG: group II intron reverse transcriptase/maturase [Gammaproteobacteria bacterium]|nr:group II intron reverse transcriptase/maturase [Gammaproteobacteria bacterium]MDE2345296.1 group II intron reverse transcriptase/maturase [Gammaproteobacteria bacterium]
MSNSPAVAVAPLTYPTAWHHIDWCRAERHVRSLQQRIAAATKQGHWRQVRRLQWLLTHSFSGKALAIRRVVANKGKRTPGVDGETWSTPADKTQALWSLKSRGYQPKPLRRVYIPKANGKRRPLGIPTMRDRAMQALYLLALEPVAETQADWNSYGFRRERCTADAVGQLFVLTSRSTSSEWILEADIQGCFDNIDHEWLVDHVPLDKAILRKWLKAGFVESTRLFPMGAGTPQGGIISPTLANIALNGLETVVANITDARKFKAHVVRYADDFVVTARSKDWLETQVIPVLARFLAERGLVLSQEKTRVVHISEGFDFLGWNVRKYSGKLLIKPSRQNVKTFLSKVRKTVKGGKALTQADLIKKLNPIIIGWVNYHRTVCAKQTFTRVDDQIWKCLWRWACRRHPRKNKDWVRRKYFAQEGARTWRFGVRSMEKETRWDGRSGYQWLISASRIPIRRHIKVQGAANPFDPDWDAYFEARLGARMRHTLAGRQRLLRLWMRQAGRCLMCRSLITQESGWHLHHLVARGRRGREALANQMLLHPNCHRQWHILRRESCGRTLS